jgi:pyruvate/2-oxoglutarate dehydrogenase complex dihydrolipoamide dehydrogenase (E3) component
VDKPHVYTAADVLKGKVDLAGKVVVIGGGLVGVETANHIAVHNQKVAVVEMLPQIAEDMESGTKHFLLESLKKNEVEIYVNAKVLEIRDDGVVVALENGTKTIPADQVVVAIGSNSDNALSESIKNQYPTDVLGDANTVGKLLEGMTNAFEAAYRI